MVCIKKVKDRLVNKENVNFGLTTLMNYTDETDMKLKCISFDLDIFSNVSILFANYWFDVVITQFKHKLFPVELQCWRLVINEKKGKT